MRRRKSSSTTSPRTATERGDRRLLSVEVFPRSRRSDEPPTAARLQLKSAIDDALSRSRRVVNETLAQHGVRSLTIVISEVGDHSFDWDWSAQLNVQLDGKLL